jgi:hypothetical protein
VPANRRSISLKGRPESVFGKPPLPGAQVKGGTIPVYIESVAWLVGLGDDVTRFVMI